MEIIPLSIARFVIRTICMAQKVKRIQSRNRKLDASDMNDFVYLYVRIFR